MDRLTRRLWLFAGTCCALTVLGCQSQPQAPETVTLQSDTDKVSYAIGYDIGKDVEGQGLGLNAGALLEGLGDALAGNAAALSAEERQRVRQAFQEKKRAESAAKRGALAEKNQQEGDAFLAQNGAREGVVTTESGLQYEVLTPGDGAVPAADDNVKVHYRGTLLDGTEFDSSYARGEPAVFPVKGVIPGWTEALQLMQEGAKWKLFVPSNLAYGERGAGRKIGPNQTLIFEVELQTIH